LFFGIKSFNKRHFILKWRFLFVLYPGYIIPYCWLNDVKIIENPGRYGSKSYYVNVILKAPFKPINITFAKKEVCEKIKDYDVIINIQGDEPLIEYEMINSLIETFKENKDLKMATLKHKLTEKEEIENPNNVKVICDKNDYAIYFSRSVIPYPRKADDISYFKHIGIYGYKRDFVIEYSKMPATALEIAESLEQLRVLENDYKIKVLETTHSLIGVDTQENLDQVINFVKKNNIRI